MHGRDISARANNNHLLAEADLGGLGHKYTLGDKVKGYSGKFSQEVLRHIRSRPEVLRVEKDSMVYASDIEKGVLPSATFECRLTTLLLLKGAPWGLARISHRKSLSFGTFNKYEYEHLGGEGVTAYIVDTYALSDL